MYIDIFPAFKWKKMHQLSFGLTQYSDFTEIADSASVNLYFCVIFNCGKMWESLSDSLLI